MSWKHIPNPEYLKLYTADHKALSVKFLEGGPYGRMMEVIMGLENKPVLRHTINPNFEVETYKWED